MKKILMKITTILPIIILGMFVLASQNVYAEALSDFRDPGSFSWTVPANVGTIRVQVWGAGGAGGNGKKIDNSHRAGQGGGAGGYIDKTITVTPGSAYGILVGAGGVASVQSAGAQGGGQSYFSSITNIQDKIGAAGGGGGVTFVWAENIVGRVGGGPTDFAGLGGTATQVAGGGRGYASLGGITTFGQKGGDGAIIQPDSRGNPVATSGGAPVSGGTGGVRGRLGADGSGHCHNDANILGLPWWSVPPLLNIIGTDDCHKDRSLWTTHGGFPGGGGGGSDTGLGGNGGNGRVLIEFVAAVPPVIPGGSPSDGGTVGPIVTPPPSNPSDGGTVGGGTPNPTPRPPTVSTSGGYNQPTVTLLSKNEIKASSLASQQIYLSQVPYTGSEDVMKVALFVGICLVLFSTPFIAIKFFRFSGDRKNS